MLSHQLRAYSQECDEGYYYDCFTKQRIWESSLSIPAEAPVGGELLTYDGTKGFYIALGDSISLESAVLEGDGADKFKMDGNTITLNGSVSEGETYNFNHKNLPIVKGVVFLEEVPNLTYYYFN